MRRLLIFLFWLTRSRNNVTWQELLKFCIKPPVHKIAMRYIKSMESLDNWVVVSFNLLASKLYWPKEYPTAGIYQVTAETFDRNDWHYYQKTHTQVEEKEVMVDVGAAEGLFSLTVIDKCEKVILIEPNKHFIASLGKTFSGYGKKVQLINVAVGEHEGEMTFDSDSLQGKVGAGEPKSDKMEVTTVDRLLADQGRISYLKADLEGFELDMLKGAAQTIKKHKPKMAITTYHIENDAAEIIALIKSYVPEYQYYVKGIHHLKGKPVMVHFWI